MIQFLMNSNSGGKHRGQWWTEGGLQSIQSVSGRPICFLHYNVDISESWQSRHGVEPRLPGLPYSQAQFFWLSAANVWCAKYRTQALNLRLLTGVHSPDIFRVHGQSDCLSSFLGEILKY